MGHGKYADRNCHSSNYRQEYIPLLEAADISRHNMRPEEGRGDVPTTNGFGTVFLRKKIRQKAHLGYRLLVI